jgi:hypothetical protein
VGGWAGSLGSTKERREKSVANIRFDHFITYTSAADIDDYLKEYAAMGFVPLERTVRHEPGLRNGFVRFGPEYIEFCWVEDEALFEDADEEEKLLRAAPRPFGLGIVSDEVQAVHDDWTARGFSVPEVSSKAARDAPPDSPPVWSFQVIPDELLPGASCFVLTYHLRPRDQVMEIKIAPNSVYAISGVTLVSAEPEARAACWRDLLAPGEPVLQTESGFQVWIGAHWARWMTAGDYEASYGLNWSPNLLAGPNLVGAPHPIGEMAILHLLASDLGIARSTLEQAGRKTTAVPVGREDGLLVAPDARDGFVFVLRQQPPETWLRERVERTGEKLRLAQD